MQLLIFLHECLSFASLSAVPYDNFFKSPPKVFLRVIFGLPCFLLPGGFHLKPFLGILLHTFFIFFQELYVYVSKYYGDLMVNLNENINCVNQRLGPRLENVAMTLYASSQHQYAQHT